MDLTYGLNRLVYWGPGTPAQARFLDPLGEEHGPYPVTPLGVPVLELDLSSLPRRDGRGVLVWEDGAGDELLRETLFLGRFSGRPRLPEAVAELGLRLRPSFRGRAVDGTLETLSDPSLEIGGSATGRFLLRLSGLEAGQGRRVREQSGAVLFLERPFLLPIQVGEPYVLIDFAPDLLRSALEQAFRVLAHTVRVEQVLDWQELSGPGPWELVLPEGWEAVFQVWGRTEEGTDLLLPPRAWDPVPGRKVRLQQVGRVPELAAVRVVGFRSGAFPARAEGEVEGDLATLVAQASLQLFLSGAAGSALDPEERLRKTVLAAQEAEQGRLRRRNRIPVNSRPVLE